MGGSNPYIEEVKYKQATKKFKVTFLPSGKTMEVDPEKIPYGHNGLPGSILDFSEALKAGLDHACGGVCACSTCHVMVKEGLESCNEATDAELDELDEAPGITPKSRLGCQTVPDGTTDIVVEIPGWNKNYDVGCSVWHSLAAQPRFWRDRKSTRLNSSHQIISYAVFCLKKKLTRTPCAPNSRAQLRVIMIRPALLRL